MSLFSHCESQPQVTNKRKRRPAGVSRRRKKDLGFEPLEDRRVMSASSLLNGLGYTTTSYSSATAEGQAYILQQELYRAMLQSLQSTGTMAYDTRAIPTDPLLNGQWHLINSGQSVGNPDFQAIFGVAGEDINVAPVWNQGIFGNGVVVGVFEPGAIQTIHPDLAANFNSGLSYGQGTQPDSHATAVAGLIGAVANNGIGGTGVAPGATLVAMAGAGFSEFGNAGAFIFAMQNGIDIVNNSWGPLDANQTGGRQVAGMTPLEVQAMRDSIFFGRDGLGVIYVWASGNGGEALDSAAYDGYQNSRYVISVTGVDHDGQYNNVDGTVTGYMEAGPSVLVAAPTSSFFQTVGLDQGIGSGIVTTDLIGAGGTNNLPGGIVDRDFLPDLNYMSRFNGTSASAPIVSGVVALMLEANPNLSWRDVQEILVRSARQNAEFGTQANGIDKALGIEFQNTWVINQAPIFHDPDVYDPQIPNALQIITPTLDPNLSGTFNGLHYAATPQVLTNGAGYTVSLGVGTNGELVGYGHGVVDAELAVLLAKQWTTKNQHLPAELTFTTAINTPGDNDIPAAEVMPETTLDFIVPGGLFGDPGFLAYWNEYFDDQPFVDFNSTAERGYPVELVVPGDNAMTISTVEVKLTISGGAAEALDHLRILLVSPNGTYSELNHYYLDSSLADDVHQATAAGFDTNVYFGEPGSVGDGLLEVTFLTNRNWGERSDAAIIINPETGLPYINQGFASPLNPLLNLPGEVVRQGWQLIFENYGTANLNLEDLEISWHGSPIQPGTQRIQGLVGVDDNQDDFFNYSRVIQAIVDIDGDPTTTRLGEVQNIIDPDHESMGANVTVTARRVSDNAVVARFVTGADGNFYFDLVPDEYIISIEDPQGRVALEDSLSPSGILQDYKTSWHITEDYFRVWNRDASLEVPIDPNTGAPIPFIDGNGNEVAYGMSGINFLLDPGLPPPPQVQFSGVVSADFNGDGIFNGNDVAVPGVRVYADVNRNGALDAGEIVVTTNANGQYNLVVPNTIATVMNVGVVAPVNWTFSNPAAGFTPLFVEAGDVFTGINFAVRPPLGASVGDGSSNAGYLMGVVYEDANNNSSRQATELGVPGIQVFIDTNNNGTRESNEPLTTTNANGAYIFANVAPGTHRVRAIPVAPLLSINPGPGVPRIVNLAGGGTTSQIEFGIGLGSNPSTSNLDYGDLPPQYGITLLAENGARHGRSAYFLGERIDVETNGQPSANADGDDAVGNDEDGIVVTPLIPGTTGTLTAVASRHGGVLQGWVDFNGDFDFDDPGERILTNVALVAGVNNLTFQIPAALAGASSATGGVIYARFRYGEYGINSVRGAAAIGEVEDYILARDPSALPAVIMHGPDFDEDGDVDGRDFLTLQRNYGKTNATGTQGDANGDGVVGYNDLVMWRNYYGTTVGGYSAFTADDEGGSPAAILAVEEPLDEQVAVVLDGVVDQPEEAPLIEAILIVDTDGSANVVEVSAQASTSVVPGQVDTASVAAAFKLLSSDGDVDAEEAVVVVEADDLDAVFGSSSDLTDLGLALKKDESGAYRYDDDDLAGESDEDNVFALAFADEADWLQF